MRWIESTGRLPEQGDVWTWDGTGVRRENYQYVCKHPLIYTHWMPMEVPAPPGEESTGSSLKIVTVGDTEYVCKPSKRWKDINFEAWFYVEEAQMWDEVVNPNRLMQLERIYFNENSA